MPSVPDEEKQTEEMLAELNRQTSLNRNFAEMERQMQGIAAAKLAQRKRVNRKWNGVKQVAFCTLCTAALYGFEQIGLPHGLSIMGMLFLASYSIAIAVTLIADEKFVSRMKKKVIHR